MDADRYPGIGVRSGTMTAMEDAAQSVPPVEVFDLGPRVAWAWLTAGFGLLGIAESVALAALVHAVLPGPVGYLVDVLVIVPTFGLLIAIASGLGGRITVDAERLRLQFGLLGGAEVSKADIAGAERYEPPAIRPIGLGINVPSGSRQATASRGGQVLFVRVLLERPIQVRVALWRRESADELVMGTGSPDQLIAALG